MEEKVNILSTPILVDKYVMSQSRCDAYKKNMCDNLIYILFNETKRTTNYLNAWRGLQVIGIRKDLWFNDKGKYQPCLFTITNAMKDAFIK